MATPKHPSLPARLKKTLQEVLSVPTGPFMENFLIDAITARLKKLAPRIAVKRDRFDNLLIQYREAPRKPAAFAFQAHLDHPGFRYREQTSSKGGIAEVLGGMSPNIVGGKIRFYSTARASGVSAKILECFSEPDASVPFSAKRVMVRISHRGPVAEGTLGMWDYPALKETRGFLKGRAFDDNLSVATLIFLLEDCARKKVASNFDVLLTRAEEVGFIGCLATLEHKTFKLPKLIVNLEMPRANNHIEIGNGVVVRVGDANLNYDVLLTASLQLLASQLSEKSPSFKFQRRLGFTGGTEVAPFILAGYSAGALCVPVEHAHNRDDQGRPQPERVAVSDLLSFLEMITALAVTAPDLKAPRALLLKRFEQYLKSSEARLLK